MEQGKDIQDKAWLGHHEQRSKRPDNEGVKGMTSYQMNPLFMHIIEDYRNDGLDIGQAISNANKMWENVKDKDRKPRHNKKWVCPKCNSSMTITKEKTN